MVIVTLREERQKLRQQRHFRFAGQDIARSVRHALQLMFALDCQLDQAVTTPGEHRRVLERETLLSRRVVITVRVQGELWGGSETDG